MVFGYYGSSDSSSFGLGVVFFGVLVGGMMELGYSVLIGSFEEMLRLCFRVFWGGRT